MFSNPASTLLPALLFLSSLAAAAPPTTLTRRQYDATACNNHPSLCSQKYDSIVHLGTHDSPFLRTPDNGYSIAGNQYYNVQTQLDAGVRLLQGQIHLEGGKPRLCHSDCRLMDGGKLEEYLAVVKKWMDTHPSEVVTMLWVNADNMPARDVEKYFTTAGLSSIAYIPPKSPIAPGQWPTLREMIDSKKRLVVFLSTSTDEKVVPWLLDEFNYIFETPFENFDPAKFTCEADRPGAVKGGGDKLKEAVRTRIGLQNRFLYDKKLEKLGLEIYTPHPKMAPKINSGDQKQPGNLKDGINKCNSEWGRKGGFLLVDFFNEGNAMSVVDAANGFSDPRNRINPPADYKSAAKQFWEPTPSAGKMSLPLDLLQDVGDGVKDDIRDAVDTIKDGVDDKIVDPVKEGVQDKIVEPAKGVVDKVKDWFGGWFR